MDPLGKVQSGAATPPSSHPPIPELRLTFHDTLSAGDRLWVRGRLALDPSRGNGHGDRPNWWKLWRKNGETAQPPVQLETRVSGQVLESDLTLHGDGEFEALLNASLPEARRGWRVARNRVALNGFAAEACNVVLVQNNAAAAAVVVLPLEATWHAGDARHLAGAPGSTEILLHLQSLQQSTDTHLLVHYVALVPLGSDLRRSDLALAIAELGWPAGHLLVTPCERAEQGSALAKTIERLRWLFCGTLDVWLFNLAPELASAVKAVLDPCEDRAIVREAVIPSRFNGFSAHARQRPFARPTRAALLPRSPVVFCHGMLGYSMLKFHLPADWNYFSALRNFLDPRGVGVLFPKVGPTSGVAERAEQLREQIVRWTDEPVNIVAHSMGGLDARYMIAHLGMAERVRSLTTVATPHFGSHMADWFQANFRRRLPLLLALEAVGVNVDGFRDCRPGACDEFNAATPNGANVQYFSYGGDVPPARLTPFLRRAWGILTAVEGPNDGLVSVKSARWGEYVGTIQADHFAQTPDRIFVRDGEDFDALGFYTRLIDDLARRGF